MKKQYDEFRNLTSDRMAQTMTDVTYGYRGTVVPKVHYKKFLDDVVDIVMPEVIDLGVLDVYVKTLKHMIEEQPHTFLKALVCIDKKLKPSDLRPQEQEGLKACDSYFSNNNISKFVNEEVLSAFDDERLRD